MRKKLVDRGVRDGERGVQIVTPALIHDGESELDCSASALLMTVPPLLQETA